jgi:hypothetical protein
MNTLRSALRGHNDFRETAAVLLAAGSDSVGFIRQGGTGRKQQRKQRTRQEKWSR